MACECDFDKARFGGYMYCEICGIDLGLSPVKTLHKGNFQLFCCDGCVLESEGKKMRSVLITIGFIALLALMIGCSSNATGNAITDSNHVSIPLSDLSNEARFYTFNDGGANINYFVVLGSDEKPRTAFDACDVCGGYKGYQQNGEDIICRNCGRVFSIDGLGTKNKGYGCWPSYLPHEIEGDNILIKIVDLKRGKTRFV